MGQREDVESSVVCLQNILDASDALPRTGDAIAQQVKSAYNTIMRARRQDVVNDDEAVEMYSNGHTDTLRATLA